MKDNKHPPPGVEFEPFILEKLKDPELAAQMLNAAIEDFMETNNIDIFNAILKDIVKAQNISELSKSASISRNQLYRIIEGKSEPKLTSFLKIFHSLGYQLQLKPIDKSA